MRINDWREGNVRIQNLQDEIGDEIVVCDCAYTEDLLIRANASR